MVFLIQKKIPQLYKNFKNIVDDIIGHERIHLSQFIRNKSGKTNSSTPLDFISYFSDKEEIMAFSWNIANDIAIHSKNLKEAFPKIKNYHHFGEYRDDWTGIKKYCSERVVKQYKKLIYQYLVEIFNRPTK